VARLPELRLVVKPHPQANDTAEWEVLGRTLEAGRFAVTTDYCLDTLLAASDAVIVQWTTVGLQAIARQKPVIVLRYTGEETEVVWAAEGAAIRVEEPGGLEEALRKVLWDQGVRDHLERNSRRLLQRYLFLNDGRAWERIANAIGEMMSGNEYTTAVRASNPSLKTQEFVAR
jgi:hypothetical protein